MYQQQSVYEVQREIIDDFRLIGDNATNRLEYIMDLGEGMADMAEEDRVDENRVHGCVSQVWIKHRETKGRLYLTGYSDALIVKGLLYLVLKVFDGQDVVDIVNGDVFFIDELGLDGLISSRRFVGLDSIVRTVKSLAANYSLHK